MPKRAPLNFDKWFKAYFKTMPLPRWRYLKLAKKKRILDQELRDVAAILKADDEISLQYRAALLALQAERQPSPEFQKRTK